jgi:type IV pilus assembly protein PilC
MPEFVWKAKSVTGETVKGEMAEVNPSVVAAKLRKMRYREIKVKKKPKDIFADIEFFQPKITTNDIVVFTRQFATMIDAGLPLVQSLEILAAQQENAGFKKILYSVKSTVEGGTTFAEALSRHPKIFDQLFVNLVRAGEIGGVLDTILRRLSGFLEKSEALKRKVKGAMVYPIVVFIVAFAVVAILLVYVVPVFKEMYSGSSQSLPGPTVLVIGISEFVQKYILLIIILFILGVMGIKRYYRTEGGRLLLDRLMLRLPGVGNLLKKVAVARFCATLGTMISSGVPILSALDITAKTAGNRVIENAIVKSRYAISEGRPIADPLAESEVFPGMVIRMIAVGEQTGALDAMLAKISEFYEDEVDTAVGALTQLLEPVMITFLGVVCGGLIIALYLPIFSMAGAISGGK